LAEVYLAILDTDGANLMSADEAFRNLNEVVGEMASEWPDRVEGHSWLGWVAAFLQHDLAAAAEHYRRALEIEPDDLRLLGWVARFAAELDRPELATEISEYVVARDPLCVPCFTALGDTYLRADRVNDAIRAYERALVLRPTDFILPYALALVWAGSAETAITYIESYQDPAPNWHVQMRKAGALARALHALGRQEEFERAKSEFLQLVADHPATVAQFYAELGDLDTAFEIAINAPYEQLQPITMFDNGLRTLKSHERWPELAQKVDLWPTDPRDDIDFQVSLLR
jgi:tetratricopeptide (TPR) repeat protein